VPGAVNNFFPHPDSPDATQIHYRFACGDHGNTVLDEQDFEYNAPLEAWIRTQQELRLCLGPDRSTNPTPASSDVQVHLGTARGLPGETVMIPITIDPKGEDVSGVEIDLPFPEGFSVVDCDAEKAERLVTNFRISTGGVRAVINGLDWIGDWQRSERLPDGTRLCTCRIHISPHISPGTYPIALSGVLVNSEGWLRLHATATEGGISVLEPATRAAKDTPSPYRLPRYAPGGNLPRCLTAGTRLRLGHPSLDTSARR